MPGKPFQSKLTPYRKEIAELRKTWPPTTYKEISQILENRHGIKITANSIWSFVKIRALNATKKIYTLPDTDENLVKEDETKIVEQPTSQSKANTGQPSPPANRLGKYRRDTSTSQAKAPTPLFTDDQIIR